MPTNLSINPDVLDCALGLERREHHKAAVTKLNFPPPKHRKRLTNLGKDGWAGVCSAYIYA